jgi:hypothetical protein
MYLGQAMADQRHTGQLPEDWTLKRLRALEPTAELTDLPGLRVIDVTKDARPTLQPDLVINIGGQYLVRAGGLPEWWMGQLDKGTGEIHCWGTYGTDLEDAIEAL